MKGQSKVNLRKQHIGKIFTILAGLIIFAHAVVPHHHHFDLNYLFEQETACESTSSGNSGNNGHFHCHAFNILFSEKTKSLSQKKVTSTHFTEIIAGIEALPTPSNKQKVADVTIQFQNQFYISDHSRRGPPSIV